jgi:hypothetical protein
MAQKMTEVGGVPLFFSYTGTATSGPAAVTITTPNGFFPSYVRSCDGKATNPNVFEWFEGMPAASAIVTTGSSGDVTYISADGFTVAKGSIVLGTGVLNASTVYSVAAFRHDQVGNGELGGTPLFFAASGTSASSEADVTITTAPGFYPDWVLVIDDYNATNPCKVNWFKGSTNPSGILTTGSTGVRTALTTTGITVASGSIIIGTGCQINDGNYVLFAGRFSQIGSAVVGGTPVAFGYNGTSASSEAAIAITTPDGFYPDWVLCVDDFDATNPSPTEWFVGQANPSCLLNTGSTGVVTVLTTTGITPASGSITIGTGCQVNSGNYAVYAARYSL